MRAVIINYSNKVGDFIAKLFLGLVCLWVMFALSFQVYMVYLEFSGKTETTRAIVDWFNVTFDGRWANDPRSIWYEEPKKIDISSVTNKVVVGSLAGNRNLEFGIKNILEEVLQDKEYELDKSANLKLAVEIIYLDVLKTQSSFSVLHNNKESVVIRLRGQLFKDGKLQKKVVIEE